VHCGRLRVRTGLHSRSYHRACPRLRITSPGLCRPSRPACNATLIPQVSLKYPSGQSWPCVVAVQPPTTAGVPFSASSTRHMRREPIARGAHGSVVHLWLTPATLADTQCEHQRPSGSRGATPMPARKARLLLPPGRGAYRAVEPRGALALHVYEGFKASTYLTSIT
jgi:hypothetical protein